MCCRGCLHGLLLFNRIHIATESVLEVEPRFAFFTTELSNRLDCKAVFVLTTEFFLFYKNRKELVQNGMSSTYQWSRTITVP